MRIPIAQVSDAELYAYYGWELLTRSGQMQACIPARPLHPECLRMAKNIFENGNGDMFPRGFNTWIARLNVLRIGKDPVKNISELKTFLVDELGHLVFACIHRDGTDKPIFGNPSPVAAVYGNIGNALRQYPQYLKACQRVNRGEAEDLSEWDTWRKLYFEAVGRVNWNPGNDGYTPDFWDILPRTYIAGICLERIKEQGELAGAGCPDWAKNLGEVISIIQDPLSFWEEMHRRISFTSPVIQKEPARLSKSLHSKTEIGKWVSVNESSDEKVYRARAEDFMNRYPGLATQQGPRSYRVNWSTLQEVWKAENITPIERPNFKTA